MVIQFERQADALTGKPTADVAESWNFEKTLSLVEALRRLMDRDPNIGRVVQLRFFTTGAGQGGTR